MTEGWSAIGVVQRGSWREALLIDLIDCRKVIGKEEQLGLPDGYIVDGDNLADMATLLGRAVSPTGHRMTPSGERVDLYASLWLSANYDVPWTPYKAWALVRGPNWLEMRVQSIEGGPIEELTYCGRFSIIWKG